MIFAIVALTRKLKQESEKKQVEKKSSPTSERKGIKRIMFHLG